MSWAMASLCAFFTLFASVAYISFGPTTRTVVLNLGLYLKFSVNVSEVQSADGWTEETLGGLGASSSPRSPRIGVADPLLPGLDLSGALRLDAWWTRGTYPLMLNPVSQLLEERLLSGAEPFVLLTVMRPARW